ncbi:MAG: cysteine desulfurase family protein [Candidatus Eiseniibacteriota bacterium]
MYLYHNATTPFRREGIRAVQECLDLVGNPSSMHRFGQAARKRREEARSAVAEAAGCPPGCVFFTSGGTEANNLALRGGLAARGGGHLVVAGTEHEAVLQTAEHLASEGGRVTVLGVDREGRIDLDELRSSLRAETALVSLMAANNETGALLPLVEVGEICRSRGVPFHTDAVQLFGKLPFRWDDLPVELASISSHKIGGPKGVGALLVRESAELRPVVTGGGQERGLRPGTENLPGIAGFGAAARQAASQLAREVPRILALRNRLEQGILRDVPETVVNAVGAERLPNTSNVTFAGTDGESLAVALDLEGIAVSTGAACNAGAAEPSHVLRAMGRTREAAGGSIRFSLGFATTAAEIEEVLSVLPAVTRRIAGSGTIS